MNTSSPANQTNDPGSLHDSSAKISNQSSQEGVPIVFISYSHDTKEHKAWVAALAQRLADKGVDVLLDQWDLGPGDDVPKFMEKAVAKSDRVLMVCTEAYVRKADDGKGGVGYEAMVVTGELVQNLGTSKFVPIIRQTGNPKVLPRCVSTRFYVDLSDGAEAEENFEILFREIHNVPKLSKPPLGKNPFVTGTFEGSAKQAAENERRLEFSASLLNPEAAYERALAIIHSDDRVAWRRLLLAASEQGAKGLRQWRSENPNIPDISNNDWSARFAHVQLGVEQFAPFIACVVAAAETGRDGYANQLGWIEPILDPSGYDKSGFVYHATFCETIIFVAQALTGGMLILSGSGEAAYQLATTKIQDYYRSREALPLFSMNRCVGWPESLEHHCLMGWRFLNSLIASWPWIKKAYGDDRQCRSGISAFYQILSFLNFIKVSKEGQIAIEGPLHGSYPVTVPLSFCVWPQDVVMGGYRSFLKQAPILRRVLEANKIDQASFEAEWTKWMTISGTWLGQVYSGRWPEMHVPQRELPKDLNANPYSLG